jgi:antitoxin (DNA-binding transcriptional repressor) of toxin-antitoxin stability system
MRTLTVGDLKANFSTILKNVQHGEEIAIAFGKKKEIVAYIIPKELRPKTKRILGLWEGKGTVTFNEDFKMTEEEFLGV